MKPLRCMSVLAATAMVMAGLALPAIALAAAADGKLQELITAARKESRLDLMITSSAGEKGARDLTTAFKKRFGLENVNISPDLTGQESQKFNRAVAEAKSGIPPTFDLMQGEAANVLSLLDAGGAERIPDWEVLLRGIAPETYKVKEKISPETLAGWGFLWSTRTVGLLYNPKHISEAELPKTWKQKADPKYRGAFSMPPWISALLMGILKYDKGEWLEIVKGMGANKRQVLTYDAAGQRMLLGDLKFFYGNADIYFEQKKADPNAPIGLTFFEDLTTMRQVLYVVRKGAKSPNLARLFALWATSAEANEIFEKYAYIENLVLGTGPISRHITKTLKQRKIDVVSWFDNPQTVAKFAWFQTNEGKEYAKAISRAQKEGK